MKFKVCISETLERVIEIEAPGEEEAIDIAIEEYRSGEHVLTADDFVGVSFDILCN